MIVCMCEGLSDREIRAEMDRGATSVREIKKRCGASGQCGMCATMLRQMVRARQHEAPEAPETR